VAVAKRATRSKKRTPGPVPKPDWWHCAVAPESGNGTIINERELEQQHFFGSSNDEWLTTGNWTLSEDGLLGRQCALAARSHWMKPFDEDFWRFTRHGTQLRVRQISVKCGACWPKARAKAPAVIRTTWCCCPLKPCTTPHHRPYHQHAAGVQYKTAATWTDVKGEVDTAAA
jgi:hypothetical protein